ncbi:hypothetical protein [uncultured Lamprocystis sp.]|jgi:hypothetical protein|uniref:hypothetical protein n=1 Tax=uncultured Lamprocystis sp. TaxID=543132 RepID=UPI0025D0E1EA|nr:hypothetical protein [uncultured Lamprocystis sp.]
MSITVSVFVESRDVLTMQCDVLILKYAQGLYGADQAVVNALGLSNRDYEPLSPGKHLRVSTNGKLPCKVVLFVGVPRLWDFGYAEIREFSKTALSILAKEDCEKRSLAMTMHGVGYGLDEKEAFSAQVAGLMEYLQTPETAWLPATIAIVERDENRAERIAAFLAEIQATAGSIEALFNNRTRLNGNFSSIVYT